MAELPTADHEVPLIGPARGDHLHVMSYNLRVPMDPPPRTWQQRRPFIRQVIAAESPTVLATQEGLFWQLRELRDDFPRYDWIHLGREGGAKGEATAIFFEPDRLAPLDYDHVWLSDSPRSIGSTGWGNDITRMLTWVRFADAVTGKELVVLNTHLDHRSETARRRGARQLRDVVATFDAPTVVCGDFNTGVDTGPYRTLLDAGLVDGCESARQRCTPRYGTFNDWNPVPVVDGVRIDWLLTTPDISVDSWAVNTWSVDGRTPSDHWPVQALLSLR
jgi:endonuclease/exonuclease/phosphatase family metal-dependent hydrolase